MSCILPKFSDVKRGRGGILIMILIFPKQFGQAPLIMLRNKVAEVLVS